MEFQRWLRGECKGSNQGLVKSLKAGASAVQSYTIIGAPLSAILDGMATAVQCGFCSIDQLEKVLSAIFRCEDAPIIGLAVANLLVGVWERWVGEIPAAMKSKMKETWNVLCPGGFPSQAEADAAFLAAGIDKNLWECWTRIAGNRPVEAAIVRDAGRNRLGVRDLWTLARRGQITPAEFAAAARQDGVISETDLKRIEQVEEWWPSATDVISWMLKDVQDTAITTKFGLFDEFNLKYGGAPPVDPSASLPEGAPGTKGARTVEDYFKAAGVSHQTALSMWAAHWRNMAPTTLYEMLHRLRADKLGTTKIGDKDVPNADLATTSTDVFEALGQADYPPFWRDRLMAISYAVMTRTDMRRAYEVGALSPEALVSALRDRGYTATDAEKLLAYYRQANIQLASRRPAANQWVEIGYDIALCRQQLIDQGMRPDLWPAVEQVLVTRRRARVQSLCLRSYQRAFMRRVLPEDELRIALAALPLDPPQIAALIGAWTCEREANHRLLSTGAVKAMAAKGVLNSPQEVRDVLRQLGYRPRSLARLMRLWGVDKMKTMGQSAPIAPRVKPTVP